MTCKELSDRLWVKDRAYMLVQLEQLFIRDLLIVIEVYCVEQLNEQRRTILACDHVAIW